MTSSDERRAFQRLSLKRPIDGRFAEYAIRILDVSASGALIEEIDRIQSEWGVLVFSWLGQEVRVPAELVRHIDGRPALHFTQSSVQLNELIARSAEELLRAQNANASGNREANRIGDETLTAASAGVAGSSLPFIVCRLGDEGWSYKPALLAEQPQEGFTVSSRLLPEQIEMLCETYETGNPESRRLTRLLAELSVTRSL